MSTPFLGEIRYFAFDFPPRFWTRCDGQILSIVTNTALFSLLGTTYGGNGVNTFALPDLRGRRPVHWGQGPGLSSVSLGENAGVESVTLLASQLPAHTHAVPTAGAATTGDPTGAYHATSPQPIYAADIAADTKSKAKGAMVVGTVSASGGSQPHPNLPPYLVLNACIAITGLFPSRN